jgi:hypothetical protein
MSTLSTKIVGSTFRLAALAGMIAAAASADAAITGVTGQTTWLGVNPPNAQAFNLTGPNVYAWNEQSGSIGNTPLNLIGNGVYTGNTPFLMGSFSGGFESHMLHYDPAPNVASASGSVTFSGIIVGVIFDETLLSATDASLGSLTTVYDTGNFLRSFNGNILGSTVFSVAGNTLNFQINLTPGQINRMFEVRVVTVLPAPGVMALAGLGTLAACRRARR